MVVILNSLRIKTTENKPSSMIPLKKKLFTVPFYGLPATQNKLVPVISDVMTAINNS